MRTPTRTPRLMLLHVLMLMHVLLFMLLLLHLMACAIVFVLAGPIADDFVDAPPSFAAAAGAASAAASTGSAPASKRLRLAAPTIAVEKRALAGSLAADFADFVDSPSWVPAMTMGSASTPPTIATGAAGAAAIGSAPKAPAPPPPGPPAPAPAPPARKRAHVASASAAIASSSVLAASASASAATSSAAAIAAPAAFAAWDSLVPEHVVGRRRLAVVAALQRHANPQLLAKPPATYDAKQVILQRDAKGLVRCPHCLMGGFAHKGAVSNHIKQMCTGCEECEIDKCIHKIETKKYPTRLGPTSSTSTASCLRRPRLRSRGRLGWLASSHIFSTFVDSQRGRSRARRSSRPHSG